MYDDEKEDVLGEDEFKMDDDGLDVPEGIEDFGLDEEDPETNYH